MARFCTRALAVTDRGPFAAFEQANREPFEQFNEPHPPHYYTEAGLRHAFDRLVERQTGEVFFTRVVTPAGSTKWAGKGSLMVHRMSGGAFATVVYQTDQHQWRQGAASFLLADLMHMSNALGLHRADALIASDNMVSLHLLRRAGFKVSGWASPAILRRGTVDCLQLSRPLRHVVSAPLASAHMDLAP